MDFPRVIELKRKLMTEKSLQSIWEFFLDHLGENPTFLDACEKTDHEFLEGLVEQVASQLFPQDGTIKGLWLKAMPEHSMIHGAFFAGPRISAVIYFEDVEAGLIAFCGLGRNTETKCIRFSGKPLATGEDVSRN